MLTLVNPEKGRGESLDYRFGSIGGIFGNFGSAGSI
jgi:hypothetical protein